MAALLLACGGTGGPRALPEETEVYTATLYVDPERGDDSADGRTESTPLRSLEEVARRFPRPGTLVALRRGSVYRLNATALLRGGSSSGWVTYGAYGDATAPRPIVLGSVAIEAARWSAPDAEGIRTLDWRPFLDTSPGRSATGVEQGPGNLWFFEDASPGARMTSWGWRKERPINAQSAPGDWYYDAAEAQIRLRWPEANPPAFTEAGVNRTMLSLRGQSYVRVQELDLRYGGFYAIQDGTVSHVRIRRVDFSFLGGGTKVGEYVRAGNAVEFGGNHDDIVVEGCRIHQVYDTGIDPQNVGSQPVTQRGWTVRNNLITYPGLAGFELWGRPAGSRLEDVRIEGNTVLGAGRGWGYEQHDHVGNGQSGGALVMFRNDAAMRNIVVRNNVFARSRMVFLAEFHEASPNNRAAVRALSMDENLWSLTPGDLGVVLFEGTPAREGMPAMLGSSPVFADLRAWQSNTVVPGKDASSVQVENPEFDAPTDASTQDSQWIRSLSASDPARPQRLGPFALAGDYRRTRAVNGRGWGWSGL